MLAGSNLSIQFPHKNLFDDLLEPWPGRHSHGFQFGNRQIAAELRAQYLLQYLSNNNATAGKFLRIKVATPARPELRIRARQGYYKKG